MAMALMICHIRKPKTRVCMYVIQKLMDWAAYKSGDMHHDLVHNLGHWVVLQTSVEAEEDSQ